MEFQERPGEVFEPTVQPTFTGQVEEDPLVGELAEAIDEWRKENCEKQENGDYLFQCVGQAYTVEVSNWLDSDHVCVRLLDSSKWCVRGEYYKSFETFLADMANWKRTI